MLKPYNPDAYRELENPIAIWSGIARRQAAKDMILIPAMLRYFVPGTVLELGAGVGQIARIIRAFGFNVVASDYQDFFVEHMKSIGLKAYFVDALDISAANIGTFDNIFSQSITPLITCDEPVLRRAYKSMYESLNPGGRIVVIHGMCNWRDVGKEMRRHVEIAKSAGYRDVRAFRNQLLPSRAYAGISAPVAARLEAMLGNRLGSRFVLVGTRNHSGSTKRGTTDL